GVILVALYVSCAAVAMAIAARKPVLASAAVVVAAGWPATLLTGPEDLLRGIALLAVVLSLVVSRGDSPSGCSWAAQSSWRHSRRPLPPRSQAARSSSGRGGTSIRSLQSP